MSSSQWQHKASDFGHRIPAPLILVFALILMQLSSGTAKIIMTPENLQGLTLGKTLLLKSGDGLDLSLGAYDLAEGPDGGHNWQLKFGISYFFN